MDVWSFIEDKLPGTPVILLYVIHSYGSSPGRQGFKMAVAADAETCGSIGGGIMEHKFVEMAKVLLRQNGAVPAVHRQVHDKAEAHHQSGMICSGEQTIFLYRVLPQDLPAIKAMVLCAQYGKNGTLKLSPAGIEFSEDVPAFNFQLDMINEQDFIFLEKTGPKNILHIIGGGHCALALSRVMCTMDFHISLHEERAGLKTMAVNNFVHTKNVVETYAELETSIPGGDNVYVVIMTMGYRTDDMALKAVMSKNYRYLGVLGSRNKINKMYATLDDGGLLAKIKSPVGLPIKSQTPEEIAISIAAEIIAEKNKYQ